MNDSMLTYTDMPDEVLDRLLYDIQHGLPENPLGRVEIALGMLCNVGSRLDAMAARFDAIDVNPGVPKWLESFCDIEEKAVGKLLEEASGDTALYHHGTQDVLKRLRATIARQ